MPIPETKSDRAPPNAGAPVALGFAGDEIEDIAERIMALKPGEAGALAERIKIGASPVPR